jgi:phage gp29-like protein
MPSIRDRITAAVAKWIPTKTLLHVTPRSEPAQIASTMDVSRVHAAFRAAETGATQDLFALYRDIITGDSHMQGELSKRKLAMLKDKITFSPWDDASPEDARAAQACKTTVANLDSWLDACKHLLDSCLWPVSVVEKLYSPSGSGFLLRELKPVPYHLLDLTGDELKIRDTAQDGTPMGTSHDADPMRYIIHRGHLLSVPDRWGGPMRSLVWWWLLGTMDLTWWARFLDRFGSPFLVGKYDSDDDRSRVILESAFSYATKIGGLVVTRETEVDIKQAITQSADSFERFHQICQREKSKAIVGGTLSAEAQSTGLGSGVANSQETVRQDIRQWDGMTLSHTLRTQLFRQFLAINGFKGNAPIPTWGTDSPYDLAAITPLIAALPSAGLELTDDGIEILNQRTGLLIRRAPIRPAGIPGLMPLAVDDPMRDRRARAEAAHDANSAIAQAAAPDLAKAFRGAYAPIADAIRLSTSQGDLEQRLRELTKTWRPGRAADVMAEALEAFAANGAAVHAR